MATNNSINASTAGIQGYNSTGTWTGTAVTQYNVIVGGSATDTLANVAPSATSGVPLISGGSSANPSFGTALVAGGGTGSTSFNTYGVVVTGVAGTTALASLSLSSGQLVIGGTSTPAAGTITAGAGISVANGNNSITIAGSGGGFTWNDVTGGSATCAAQNGYLADKSTLTTFTLPTNNAIGDTILIVGVGSGGWKIVYATNQKIIFGTSTSTTSSGNVASTNTSDCCTLVCTTASASAPIFTITNAVGNLTVA